MNIELNARWGRRAVMASVLTLAVAWSAFGATSAEAVAFTWFNGTSKAGVWHSKGLYAATYSRHTTSTYDDSNYGAIASQSIPGLGTASSPGSVTSTFTKRQGTFKCKWNWYGQTGTGILKCTFA